MMRTFLPVALSLLGTINPLFSASEVVFEDNIHPVFQGLLLLGKEEDVVQEGAEGVKGFKTKDLYVPGSVDQLRQELEPMFVGQPITDERLLALKRKIILYYRQHNHPLMTVEVPFQDVTNGIVQFVLIESKLGKVVTKGNKWFSSSLLKKEITIKPGDPIDTEKLLRDVSWMNQNPFRHTDIIYTPGEKEDTTDIELVTKDRIPWRIYGGGDNTGLKQTGHARWFGGFDWANAFGLDHILSYQGTFSTDLRRFRGVTVHYTAFLPWHNTLIVYGGYSKAQPDIDIFSAHAHNAQASLRYQIPVHKGYYKKLEDLTFGFDWKNCNNVIEFYTEEQPLIFTKPVNITQFVLGYNYGREIDKSKLSFYGLFYISPGPLMAHQTDEDFASQRPKAKNHYIYARSSLGWDYRLSDDFLVVTQLRVQGSTGNLLASEQFGLGGYDTVRGYEERQLNTDNGLCLNLELRAKLFSLFQVFGKKAAVDNLTALVFMDYGIGSNKHLISGEKRSHYLMSVGPGVRYTISNNLSARFDWGWKLHQLLETHGAGMGHVGLIVNY